MKFRFLFVLPLVVLLLVVVGSVSYLSENPTKKSVVAQNEAFGWKFPTAKFPLTGSNGNLIAYSTIRDPGGIPQGLPVRLKIPSIGVDSAIEDALITPDGRMDVPAGSVNVAWFSLGPHPGSAGSAVIGGHFGIENGVPFVFYKLDQVKIGDKIFIVDDKDETIAFQVKAIKSFDRNADATPVFTSNDGLAHLNLITCEGTWNQVNGTYPQRLVIFTDKIPGEGGVAVDKKKAEVTTTPADAAKTTVMPTQQVTPAAANPNDIQKSIKGTSTFSQVLVASAKSLSPLDCFITFLLILAIGFITFKIIRRK